MSESLLKHFSEVIAHNRLAHAYIVEGLSSNGLIGFTEGLKDMLAVSPHDVYEIMPDGVSIKVDQIRALGDRLYRSPLASMHFVLIHPADQMNTASANSLLKLLEEPPGKTLFLLSTTHHKKLLPTIRSRAAVLRDNQASFEGYADHPEYQLITDIYRLSPGLLGSTSEPLGVVLYRECVGKQDALEKMHAISDVEIPHLLATAVLVSAYVTKRNPLAENWKAYDEIHKLSRMHQYAQNLNEKSVIDQLGLLYATLTH